MLYQFLKPYLSAEINFDVSLSLDAEFSYGVLKCAYECVTMLRSAEIGDSGLIADFISYYQKHDESCNSSTYKVSEKYLVETLEELHKQPLHILFEALENDKSNKVEAIQAVLSNDEIAVEEKNNSIEFAFFNVFIPLGGQTQIKIRERNKIDWSSYIDPLIIHANYFEQNPFSTKRDGGKFDLHFNISRCRLAYIFALTNDPRITETLDQVYKQIEIRHLSQLSDAWWNDKSFLPRFYVDFDRMINVFSNINKSNIILPYLIRYTDMVKGNLSVQIDDIVLFEWYMRIIHCAEDAYKQSKNNDCHEIINKYKQIVQELISKNQGVL